MAKEYHSRSYHRFFEGYVEENVVENGKPHINRVYMGDYYCQDCTDRKRMTMRMVTVLLYLLSIVMYGYGATRRLSCNTTWMSGAAQGLVLIVLFWFLLPLYCYLTAKRQMTVRVYRDASGLFKRLSLAASVCFGLAAAAVVVSWIGNPVDGMSQAAGLTASFVLGGIFMFVVYIVEKRTSYIVTPGSQIGPEHGITIRY